MTSRIQKLSSMQLGGNSDGYYDEEDDMSYDSQDLDSDQDEDGAYGSEDRGEKGDNKEGSDSKAPARSKTQARNRRRRRNQQMAAQAEWAKMPTTWEQVDIESDTKFFSLVEGEAEENRLN